MEPLKWECKVGLRGEIQWDTYCLWVSTFPYEPIAKYLMLLLLPLKTGRNTGCGNRGGQIETQWIP